jgi:acyl-CoA dehydrogenase
MNIDLSPEHLAFRDEIRRFLDGALDDELRQAARFRPGVFQDYETNMRWHRILYRQGWVAPAWPKEYGGAGWDLVQRYLWTIACGEADAPGLAPMGLGMCGPTLIGHGTPEQKAYYLPRILSGEDYWCQGYSEPGSGSDLASLALRADADGDHYVLNGSKIWTTHAHHANRMFLLVRTQAGGRPQQGITFLLIDMDTPGITVKPIVFFSGEHEVNQVFFDNVRVPQSGRVGPENQGWTVAKYLLEFERGGGGMVRMRGALERLRRLARSIEVGEGRTLADDYDYNAKLTAAAVRAEAAVAAENRVMASMSKGGSPGPESSLLKNVGADLGQHLNELAVEALGLYVATEQPDARTPGTNVPAVGPAGGIVAMQNYMNNRASSIAGGTNEVQKNIMAKLVLGL